MTHMHETHERTTGATDEQLARACEAADATWLAGERMPAILSPEVRAVAPFLVPPGTVIVPEAVLTAAQAVADDPAHMASVQRLRAALAAMGGER